MTIETLQQLEEKAAFVGTTDALELLFRRSPIVTSVRSAIESNTVQPRQLVERGEALIAGVVPDEHLSHEIELAAIVYLLEQANDTSGFVLRVANANSPQFAFASAFARRLVEHRRTVVFIALAGASHVSNSGETRLLLAADGAAYVSSRSTAGNTEHAEARPVPGYMISSTGAADAST